MRPAHAVPVLPGHGRDVAPRRLRGIGLLLDDHLVPELVERLLLIGLAHQGVHVHLQHDVRAALAEHLVRGDVEGVVGHHVVGKAVAAPLGVDAHVVGVGFGAGERLALGVGALHAQRADRDARALLGTAHGAADARAAGDLPALVLRAGLDLQRVVLAQHHAVPVRRCRVKGAPLPLRAVFPGGERGVAQAPGGLLGQVERAVAHLHADGRRPGKAQRLVLPEDEGMALAVVLLRHEEEVEGLLPRLAHGHGVLRGVHGDHAHDARGRGEDRLIRAVVHALAVLPVVEERGVAGDLHGLLRARGDLHGDVAGRRRDGLLPHGEQVEEFDVVLVQHAVVAVHGLGEHVRKDRGQRAAAVHVVGVVSPLRHVAARAAADLLQDGLLVAGVEDGRLPHASNPSIPVPSSV